jgi:hypothetical protein
MKIRRFLLKGNIKLFMPTISSHTFNETSCCNWCLYQKLNHARKTAQTFKYAQTEYKPSQIILNALAFVQRPHKIDRFLLKLENLSFSMRSVATIWSLNIVLNRINCVLIVCSYLALQNDQFCRQGDTLFVPSKINNKTPGK